MAERKLLRSRRLAISLSWSGFILAYVVLFVIPDELTSENALPLLGLTAIVIFTSVVCGIALVIVYCSVFAKWRGVLALVGVLVIGRWSSSSMTLPGRLGLILAVMTIDTMVVLGISLAMILLRRDVSLQLIGGLLIIFVWAALIANRLQGNIIELYLRSMSNTENYRLWWLDSLFCMLCWSVPLGMFSFLWHTLKLFRKELRGS